MTKIFKLVMVFELSYPNRVKLSEDIIYLPPILFFKHFHLEKSWGRGSSIHKIIIIIFLKRKKTFKFTGNKE